jgi:hypothetical protein
MLKKKKCATKKGKWSQEYKIKSYLSPIARKEREDNDKKVVGNAKMKLVVKLNNAKSPKGVALAAKQYHSVLNKTFKGRKKPQYTKYYTEFNGGRGSKPI